MIFKKKPFHRAVIFIPLRGSHAEVNSQLLRGSNSHVTLPLESNISIPTLLMDIAWFICIV